ncbi:MAG: hypothetical protein U0703_05515 [Anaerolineae bacterium]
MAGTGVVVGTGVLCRMTTAVGASGEANSAPVSSCCGSVTPVRAGLVAHSTTPTSSAIRMTVKPLRTRFCERSGSSATLDSICARAARRAIELERAAGRSEMPNSPRISDTSRPSATAMGRRKIHSTPPITARTAAIRLQIMLMPSRMVSTSARVPLSRTTPSLSVIR